MEFLHAPTCFRLLLVSPMIMKLLQSFNEDSNDEDPDNDPEVWKGYIYASLFLLVTMFTTFLNAKYDEQMTMLGMRMQSTLVSAIYRKSLKLSGAARKETSTGITIQTFLC